MLKHIDNIFISIYCQERPCTCNLADIFKLVSLAIISFSHKRVNNIHWDRSLEINLYFHKRHFSWHKETTNSSIISFSNQLFRSDSCGFSILNTGENFLCRNCSVLYYFWFVYRSWVFPRLKFILLFTLENVHCFLWNLIDNHYFRNNFVTVCDYFERL